MKAAALPLLLATLTSCASLEPLRPIEPRARDSLPTQALKGIAYVPAALVLGTGVLAADIACGVARQRAEEVAVDEELGRPERDMRRQIY